MAKSTIYTVGGTVQAGGGIYIKRKADDELLELCRQGEFAFILSSRQVGKSSLMVRTAQQLEKENIRSVTIDLSAIGVKVSSDEWYLGILNEVSTTLNLETDIFAWWTQYAQLGPAQRLTNFFKDILLKEVNEQIVLFFDEIDSTLSIPFSDDFYVALRAVYNARSTIPDFKRLSFVLVGVAAPSDLISDNKRTPFNIGHRVEVNDFTLAEALPLASGLGEQAVQFLTWIFQCTGGHPYLTQRLCAHLATSKESFNEGAVAKAVERLFTGEQGKQDNNLQFVRDMLSKRSPDVTRVLLIYRDIRSGKKVVDDERSITKAHLKLSGLVRSEKGILRVRNEIYNTVFNPHWVQENIPKNWQRVALISLSAVLGILILGSLAVFVNDYFVGSRIDKRFRSFISAGSPEQRLSDLAEIYRQKGILSNQDSEFWASQLFYGLSSAEDQLALFRVYGIPEQLQDDLIVVINHLYITVANVDPEENNTELLQAMHAALGGIPNNQDVEDIRNEIAAWLDGRKNIADGNYEAALLSYNDAISLNSGNPATFYERAKVYIALEQYTDALNDLESTIEAAKRSAPEMPATPTPTVSPIPASETPNVSNGETVEPTRSALTSVTTQITERATEAITTTAEPTLSLTPTPTALPIYTPNVRKYESNFTTLIEVVNAVKALIEQTAQLQIMMQTNGNNTYTNLQEVGLVQVSSTLSSPTRGESTIAFSPDGITLASGGSDNSIILWDFSNPNNVTQLATLLGHSDTVTSVVFSADGKLLASGSHDTTVILWDMATYEPISQPLTGHGGVNSMAWSADGRLASASQDNTIIIWDLPAAAPAQVLAGHTGGVNSVAWSAKQL
jgi:tetratricopeptide (TPR) repeat protein